MTSLIDCTKTIDYLASELMTAGNVWLQLTAVISGNLLYYVLQLQKPEQSYELSGSDDILHKGKFIFFFFCQY